MGVNIYPENYPHNYDWLTDKQKDDILQWFNSKMSVLEMARKNSMFQVRDIAQAGHQQSVMMTNQIRAAQEILEKLNIHIEFDWIGHRNEWFLATSQDAEMQEEHLFCMYPDG